MNCRYLFVLLFLLFGSLCCLSFFDLRSSDYPYDIFWLPLWYLLITPLVSSDYPYGIFWLPLWYLLITPMVSSNFSYKVLSSPNSLQSYYALALFDKNGRKSLVDNSSNKFILTEDQEVNEVKSPFSNCCLSRRRFNACLTWSTKEVQDWRWLSSGKIKW